MSQNSNGSELTPREKRIKETVIKYYMDNLTQQKIANEMGYNRKTIQRYLDSEFASNLKRVYSDKEIYDLKAQLETEIRDSYKMANNLLAKAIQHESVTPRDLLKATKEAQEIRMRHIQMLKELGIELEEIESSKEEDQEYEMVKRLREAYKEQQKGNQR